MIHTYARYQGQFVQKIEWKQTDGQTDTTDRITFPTNAAGKELDKRTIHS